MAIVVLATDPSKGSFVGVETGQVRFFINQADAHKLLSGVRHIEAADTPEIRGAGSEIFKAPCAIDFLLLAGEEYELRLGEISIRIPRSEMRDIAEQLKSRLTP